MQNTRFIVKLLHQLFCIEFCQSLHVAQNCSLFYVWCFLENDIRGMHWTEQSLIEHSCACVINDQTVHYKQ